MKKFTVVLLSAAVAVIGFAGSAMAFHGGGVAHCDGCHSMHNSADNPVNNSANLNAQLLKGSDVSSTCLNCHDGDTSYKVKSAAGTKTNVGGDFFWITPDATATYIVRGTPRNNDPENNGHSIVAYDFGLTADSRPENAVGPGGTYPAASLGCSSCHDPHGQIDGGTGAGAAAISVSGSYGAADPVDGSVHGNYRLLGDTGYVGDEALAFAFTQNAPVARANSYTGTAVDYGTGMSEWCANCHGDLLVADSSTGKHPSGDAVKLSAFATDYVANYNAYVASGDFTGVQASAFDDLVPIERDVADGSLLDTASDFGADANSNVMCLSCHRAHASAFDNALRWDPNEEFIAESPITDAATTWAGPVNSATLAAYYADGAIIDIETTYGPWQRSLCNKCHVKD